VRSALGPTPVLALTLSVIAVWGAFGVAQQTADEPSVYTLSVRGNVYMLATEAGNMTVQVGDQGVLLVDTPAADLGAPVLAAIRRLSDKPIHYIVNTCSHEDHTGANAYLAKAGLNRPGRSPLLAGVGGNSGNTTSVVAHDNVLKRMGGLEGAHTSRDPAALPTDTYITDDMDLFFNGEGIQILHQPSAHTDGDSIVFFRRSDVLVTGDLFLTTGYPHIDAASGGSIDGLLAALNRIVKLTVPMRNQEGGTMVVPGRGRLSDEMDVVEYRNMVTIVRDRIQSLIDEGKTVDQVKAAKPTLDYDTRYGTVGGPHAGSTFVEAVFRDLKGK
jgi:cyclase